MALQRTAVAVATAAACLAVAAPAPSAAAEPSVAVMRDCVERRGFVAGDEAAVRARVPARYEPVRNSSRAPLLAVQAIRCADLTVDGVSAPVTFGEVAAIVRSPDGRGCLQRNPLTDATGVDPSAHPEPFDVCNLFPISWASDHAAFVAWLRRGAPEFPAHFVADDLELELGAFDPAAFAAPFRFEASAPLAFELTGRARERSGVVPAAITFWFPLDGAELRVRVHVDGEFGQAEGTLTTDADGELARLLGADRRPLAAGYAELGANRWAYGEYHRAIVADP